MCCQGGSRCGPSPREADIWQAGQAGEMKSSGDTSSWGMRKASCRGWCFSVGWSKAREMQAEDLRAAVVCCAGCEL